MKKIFILAAAMVLMLFYLAGCGKSYDDEITVYNWGEYIDEDILDQFEDEYNIKVHYNTFDTNESLYSILKTGGYDIDVIICSDYLVSRLINENMLNPLNYDNIPNFSMIGDSYKGLSYDPNDEYSVCYMWGTVGLIYNGAMVDEELDSWGALFDPKYSGQIVMINNSRDAMAIALLYLGYDVNTTDEGQLREAADLLTKQRSIVQSYAMDQIFDKLEGGESAIGTYYAGDYITMLENNPDLKFVRPKEGTTWFTDAMCVPAGSKHQESAEKFIDFMCTTDVAILNMKTTGYATPVTEAWDIYAQDLDEMSKDVMAPSAEELAGYEMFVNLPQN
ncbi:MAG: spermidine/putrescine ABC transporter substrate-binding protein, partial [Oscillospiraceae bacterium]|nr:spermidine/putrescine ABC transporter substrate-binding protein [Oscillospiraceae bacterium]